MGNKDAVDFAEHQRLESNRMANINTSLSLTRQLAIEKEKVAKLGEQIVTLEAIIVQVSE